MAITTPPIPDLHEGGVERLYDRDATTKQLVPDDLIAAASDVAKFLRVGAEALHELRVAFAEDRSVAPADGHLKLKREAEQIRKTAATKLHAWLTKAHRQSGALAVAIKAPPLADASVAAEIRAAISRMPEQKRNNELEKGNELTLSAVL